MQKEILTTLLVFVGSNNREIVKSALGFVKLAIHTLSVGLLTPFLKDIVPGLLSWSHNHNNHFKVKVRHILERMIRRFGFEPVYQCAGEDEAGKVLLNIKKRKDRMKRKKAQHEEDNDDDDVSRLPGHRAAIVG
jgi:ribosomal RNA-processing protein 12